MLLFSAMAPSISVLLLLNFVVGSIRAQESGWQPNQVNATMCQWQQPRAAVIRDTVYIDGGYLWWEPGMSDGTYGQATQDGNPLGLVYQLNFSTPFSTSSNISQSFTSISKAPNGGAANNIGPQYYDGAMLANDGEFHLYGGLLAITDAFTLPGATSATVYEQNWYGAPGKQFTPGFLDETLPDGVTRYVTYGGAASVPSENAGYYFAGMKSPSAGPIFFPSGNQSVTADVLSNTLISVNMTNEGQGSWTNQTLPSSIPGRANPELVWVPVSKQGVLIGIGGVIDPVYADANQSLSGAQMAASQTQSPQFMKNVAVYDIASQQWFNQETSGQIPPALTQGCAVVASAQDFSSHSIYWYGGFDGINQSGNFSDDVYLLSVPSFMWMKVASGTAAHARAGHKCVKPYPDQMLVIGGYTPLKGDALTCVQGSVVQAFNLSSATWMSKYDPTIWSNYSIPDMITAMIGGNGAGGATTTAPSTWANQTMSSIFSTAYDRTKITSFFPYATTNVTNNTRPSVSPVPSPTSSGGGTPSWLAPVLGVVLGLVALTALIVIFCLWRRRRYFRRQGTSLTGTTEANRYRILSWVRGAGGPDVKAPTVTSGDDTHTGPYEDEVSSELAASGPENTVSEAGSTQVHEMPDTSVPQELQGTGLSYIPAGAAAAAIRPSLSPTSKFSSVSSTSTTSTPQFESTPRPDSPPLGNEELSEKSETATTSPASVAAVPAAIPAPATTGTTTTPQRPKRSPSEGIGSLGSPVSFTSPVSPPTPPQGREGNDYVTGGTSIRRPNLDEGGRRKSNFAERLDEK